VHPKIAEYLAIGVEWVWLIDPIEKCAICYSQRNPEGVLSEVLRESRNRRLDLASPGATS
jgi:Uma2 family endonuclease